MSFGPCLVEGEMGKQRVSNLPSDYSVEFFDIWKAL